MLLSTFDSLVTVKTYMFCRFTGIHIIAKDRFGWKCFFRSTWWGKRRMFTLMDWQVVSLLGQFSYIDTYEGMNVRLDHIHGLHAVDVLLHGVAFIDYLNAEKLFQSFLATRDERYICKLARLLYRRKNGMAVKRIRLDSAQMLGTELWYSYIKSQFSIYFPHFFKKIDADNIEDYDILESMNSQIRALTQGDVTKEQIINNTDCWRALTELDAKAREAAEFEKKYGK